MEVEVDGWGHLTANWVLPGSEYPDILAHFVRNKDRMGLRPVLWPCFKYTGTFIFGNEVQFRILSTYLSPQTSKLEPFRRHFNHAVATSYKNSPHGHAKRAGTHEEPQEGITL